MSNSILDNNKYNNDMDFIAAIINLRISYIKRGCIYCIIAMSVIIYGMTLNSCRPDPVTLYIDSCSLMIYNYIGADSSKCAILKPYAVNSSDIVYATFTLENLIITNNKSKYRSRDYYLLSEKAHCNDSIESIKLSLVINDTIIVSELNKCMLLFKDKPLFHEDEHCIVGENVSILPARSVGDRYDGVEYCGSPCLRLTPVDSISIINTILANSRRAFVYRSQSGYCFILDNKKILKFLKLKESNGYFMLSIVICDLVTHRKRTIRAFQKI